MASDWGEGGRASRAGSPKRWAPSLPASSRQDPLRLALESRALVLDDVPEKGRSDSEVLVD